MKTIVLISILFVIASCTAKKTGNRPATKTTPREIYRSLEKPVDKVWLEKFKADLAAEKFAIERQGIETAMSQAGKKCEVIIRGTAIRHFHIKRQKPQPENYYPDFSLYVFELKNKQEAADFLQKWKGAAQQSTMERISVETFAQNGSRVFYLVTRAEMFRPYIDHFKVKLESYK